MTFVIENKKAALSIHIFISLYQSYLHMHMFLLYLYIFRVILKYIFSRLYVQFKILPWIRELLSHLT